MTARLDARKAVHAFFELKRVALKVSEGNPLEKSIKRDFLGRMNALARDTELQAIDATEAGRSVDAVIQEATKHLETLKKETLGGLPLEGPLGVPYRTVAEVIKGL